MLAWVIRVLKLQEELSSMQTQKGNQSKMVAPAAPSVQCCAGFHTHVPPQIAPSGWEDLLLSRFSMATSFKRENLSGFSSHRLLHQVPASYICGLTRAKDLSLPTLPGSAAWVLCRAGVKEFSRLPPSGSTAQGV